MAALECTYCHKPLADGFPRLSLVTTDDYDATVVADFCDRHCVIGWAAMTAVDEALDSGKARMKDVNNADG